jgi:hypothetical protein
MQDMHSICITLAVKDETVNFVHIFVFLTWISINSIY